MLPILALLLGATVTEPADLIVENATIYTLSGTQPKATRMAVKGGRIVAFDEAARVFTGPRTRRLDARGGVVVPGFIDAHGHVAGLGEALETLDLRRARSVAEVAAKVREAAARTRAGRWIRGRGWDQTNWGGAFPSHEALSVAAPNNPVLLSRVDGHAVWVNAQALAIAGITAATRDPDGGRIVRNPAGRPTGVLIDNAEALITKHIPPPTPAELQQRIRRAAQHLVRAGLTTVHDAGVSRDELDAYRALIRQGALPVRVYAMIGGEGELWREYLQRGPEIGERLTVRSIKLMADGAMGSRGAALLAPYADDSGNTGLLTLSREAIERVARDAAAHGFQVNTHAIGDRANRTVLDAYQAVLQPGNDLRFRIEHAQVVAPADIPRFARLGVIASMQSTHATSDMRWAEARLGRDRLDGAWAIRSMLAAGVRIANGSDFPVEDPSPLAGFYAAVTRQDASGEPPGGFLPKQRLTREQALRSWTVDGAYAAFEERSRGSLERGKFADFVVLSADPMTVPDPDLRAIRVLMTAVGGEVVWSAD